MERLHPSLGLGGATAQTGASGDERGIAEVRVERQSAARRPAADRVALMFPGLVPLAWRAVQRLRPGSALRRRALGLGFRHTIAAINRRDFDVVLLGWDPDVELEFHDVEMTGIASSYHGHDGWHAFWADWLRDWEYAAHQLTAVFDFGDRILLRIAGQHIAPRTGLRMDSDSGNLLEYRDGRVKRSVVWFHWALAVEELGLDLPD